MLLLTALLLSFIVSLLLTRRFCNPDSRLHILDVPNERSLHVQPMPRSGGVAVLAAIAIASLLLGFVQPRFGDCLIVYLLAIPLAVVSFLDDRYGIAIAWRMLVHIVTAVAVLELGYMPPSLELPGIGTLAVSGWVVILIGLFVIWMINLYNFMDGMDGFAGGMAVIGFASYAILGWWGNDSAYAAFCGVTAFAAAGFLCFNFPPARIFLGDAGASVLGYLAAALALLASARGLFPLWVAVLVFSPFIVDATVTLLRRAWRGEKIWQAHKTHYYQRLVQLGWGHRRTVTAEYGLMIACAVSALIANQASSSVQLGVILTWVPIYSVLLLGVGRLEQCKPELDKP